MRALYIGAVLAGAGIVAGGAYAARGTPVAYRCDPPPGSTTADLVQAATRGCVEGMGAATVGVEDGVVVVQCRANLGTGPVVRRAVLR